jgi:hypothetical protein
MLSAKRLERIFGCPCGWRGQPGQCAAFGSGLCDLCLAIGTIGVRAMARPVRAGRRYPGCVAAGLPACGCGPADLVAAPRPEGSCPGGRGGPSRPASANRPRPRLALAMIVTPLRAIPSMCWRFPVRTWPRPVGLARRRRAFNHYVKKVLTPGGYTPVAMPRWLCTLPYAPWARGPQGPHRRARGITGLPSVGRCATVVR